MKIVFVGLSNKKDMEPFDIHTATGKIISHIIEQLNADCYKINLVQFAPLDDNGKLRYPNKKEISEGVNQTLDWLNINKPDKIILLGNIVGKALNIENSIKVHHPAYAIRNGKVNEYIKEVVNKINNQ